MCESGGSYGREKSGVFTEGAEEGCIVMATEREKKDEEEEEEEEEEEAEGLEFSSPPLSRAIFPLTIQAAVTPPGAAGREEEEARIRGGGGRGRRR